MTSENLNKSAEGWVRTNGRREAGKPVRGCRMEFRPRSQIKRAGKPRLPRAEADKGFDQPELVAVSVCGLCQDDGRCNGACLSE